MKRFMVILFSMGAVCGVTLAAWADTLELKDGRLIEGKYLGGTQQTIRFQTEGNITVYQIKDAVALTFSAGLGSVSQTMPVPQTTPAKRPQKELTIAAGTPLPIRMVDAVDINTSQPGDAFKALLDSDLIIDDVLVAPKGAPVNGRVVRADQRETVLTITLQELMVKQQTIPLTTTEYTVRDKARPLIDMNSLKIVTRSRSLRIADQSVLEFKTTAPIKLIEVSK